MTRTEQIAQTEADGKLWEDFGLLFGWHLVGFSYRDAATFRTGDTGERLTVSREQRKGIIAALECYAKEERADDTKRLDWIALNWFANRGEEPDAIENALRIADPSILRGAIDYLMEKDAEFAARIREGK